MTLADKIGGARRIVQMVVAVVGVTYLGLVLVLLHSGSAQPLRVLERPPGTVGTKVTVEIEDVQSNYTVLQANLTVLPGADC